MGDSRIPKVIHYCWFGGGEKTKSIQQCIATWRNKCPDFEIIEWNETNYDISKHPFMVRAAADKKWAFVSDYARLDILYKHGGIYLDTDVEVIRDLSPLCEDEAFIGYENENIVNDGQGFGGVKGFKMFSEMLEAYDSMDDYVESPKLRTRVLVEHGFCANGKAQLVDGMQIYPVDYFGAKNYRTGIIQTTDNTYSIHHFDGSWHPKSARKYEVLMRAMCRALGEERGMKLFEATMQLKDKIKG